MNTNKNKNASYLTHEMKNEHGGLAEASKKANEQPILENIIKEVVAISQAKDKIIYAQKTIIKAREEEIQAMEEEKQFIERLRELTHRLENMRQLPNDNNIIDLEPEDEKD